MFYVTWDEESITGLSKVVPTCVKVITEVATDGTVKREIGFDANDTEVHRSPSSKSPRGLFDLAPIETKGIKSSMSAQQFQELWARGST